METTSASSLSRFWTWWTLELDDVFAPAPRIAKRPRHGTTIELRALKQGLELAMVRAGGPETITPVTIDTLESAIATAKAGARNPVIGISIDTALCLKRETRIPPGARRDALRIALLELEAESPLKRRDILIGLNNADAGRSGADQIAVTSWVAKRSLVDPLRDALGRNGLAADFVHVWDSSTRTPLAELASPVTGADARAPHWRGSRLAFAGSLATLLLMTSAGLIWLKRQGDELARVTAAATSAAAQARLVRNDMDAQQARLARADAVASSAQSSVARISALATLTDILPDATWLTDLTIAGRDGVMSGYAASAPALVGIVDTAPTFAAARLVAPVIFDDTEEKDRFSLRFRLADVAAPATSDAVTPASSAGDVP